MLRTLSRRSRSVLHCVLVLLAAFLVLACVVGSHPAPGTRIKAATDYRPGPALSGSWFDPARSGEGFVLQVLPDGKALVFWFTYPPAGMSGEQAWLIAQDGRVEGSRLVFSEVLRPVGGKFGAGFDESAIRREPWGSLSFEFQDCGQATVHYQGPPGWGNGTRNLVRLSEIAELACSGGRTLTSSGAPALAGLRARSGAWFVPGRSGEGWAVEELGNGQTLIYWFTFSPEGQQAWTIGQGVRNGTRIQIADNVVTRGTRFGADFDATRVQRLPWGSLDFDFTSCTALAAAYQSTVAGYGAGARNAIRLTEVAGGGCIDGSPQAPAQSSWSERARSPAPFQSELAVTVLGNVLYAAGGFGNRRGFRSFDPQANSWSELPALPTGRDHLAAYALDGAVYITGGSADAGDAAVSAYRYDPSSQSWSPRPEVPFSFGSHAAVLNGKAYIGNADGSLIEHDVRQNSARVIAAASPAQRDHSQVVAFMGEIWMIGGRFPETTAVVIWDPVRERWRTGPPINRARGGFAAAVVGSRIVIAGGEVLSDTRARVENTAESYTAGTPGWTLLTAPPSGVHGTAAGTIGGRFHLVSGSTLAGSAFGATGRVFALDLGP